MATNFQGSDQYNMQITVRLAGAEQTGKISNPAFKNSCVEWKLFTTTIWDYRWNMKRSSEWDLTMFSDWNTEIQLSK